MDLSSQPVLAEQIVPGSDLAKVRLILQHQLGLAKRKYQRGLLPCHCLDNVQRICDKSPNALSNSTSWRCEPCLTTSPLRKSNELPLFAPNGHAVTLNSHMMLLLLSPSRKRSRPDCASALSPKAAQPCQRSCQLSKASTGPHWHLANRQVHAPIMPERPAPEVLPPAYDQALERKDPDMPLCSFHNVSSESSLFSPPSKHAHLRQGDLALDLDTAGLPFYKNSFPTLGHAEQDSARSFLPCTPPRKHATLSLLTSDLGSSGRNFNFSDYVNVSPTPAQPT
ncbi:hypothetical protein N7448_011305 [Penicillium atrosanguineum]|nr:hypothetical protein N7448_011305 [Penicillium atrosanguineum]